MVPSCKNFPVVQDPQSLAVNQLWKSCSVWMVYLIRDSLSHSLRAAETSRLPLPCPNLATSATMAAVLLMGNQLRDKVPACFGVFGRDFSHRWDWKGPLESIQSNPPATAGSSRPRLHRMMSRWILNNSKEVFSHIQIELPVFQFVPFVPCPVAGHYWNEVSLLSFCPLFLSVGRQILLPK